jgi:Ca2+-binding RTX toxin-like protein
LAEKVYSYRFDIYDDEDNLYETSGELIHNAGNDAQDGVSTDEFRATRSIDKFRVYRIVYTVKTINDLIVASDSKSIFKSLDYPYNYNGSQLIVIPNNDDGYNTISINDDGDIEEGYYRIMRSTDQRDWVEVYRRALAFGTRELFKDFTIDHAQVYYYYLQRFDPVNNIYAEPLYAEPV